MPGRDWSKVVIFGKGGKGLLYGGGENGPRDLISNVGGNGNPNSKELKATKHIKALWVIYQ